VSPDARASCFPCREHAKVAAFLDGAAADYITGQSINISGGGVMP
jgi:hypothetical protein